MELKKRLFKNTIGNLYALKAYFTKQHKLIYWLPTTCAFKILETMYCMIIIYVAMIGCWHEPQMTE